MRSASSYPSRMVISTNPEPDHYIRTLIDWYIDPEGYPDPEKDGVLRYFIQLNGQFIWGDTKQELIDKYKTDTFTPKPISFTFISANIWDNPLMIANNPSYLAFLEGLNEIDKARLLYGNWNVRPKGSCLIEKEWFKVADHLPLGCKTVRSYDLAASEPSDVNTSPDWTAGIKISKCKQGYYYISGDYCPLFKEPNVAHSGMIRRRAGDRNNIMLAQARHDGEDVHLVIPQDPNSAGKIVYEEMVKFFLSEGFITKKDPVPITKSKLSRFEPFATAARNGLIYVVESSFDKPTLDNFYKQITAFTGERSTRTYSDDMADACASGFNYLNTAKIYTVPKLSVLNDPTIKKNLDL